MPNVFKGILAGASEYIFKPAAELKVEDDPKPQPQEPVRDTAQAAQAARPGAESTPAAQQNAQADETWHTEPKSAPEPTPETDPIHFAKIQAEAILKDAKEEAAHYKENARAEFEAELDEARRAARDEGYSRGYAEGMAQAMQEGKLERERLAMEQIKGIEAFMEMAARARDQMLENSREELKDLAVAVAEKIIHVSLKNSSDIILRMVDAATDTHKRCEWAHIYVADCDIGGKAYTVPELTAALSHVADRVRVIPMPDEESGTCIVELPDVIYDASVSTQLDNIKEVLGGVTLEKD